MWSPEISVTFFTEAALFHQAVGAKYSLVAMGMHPIFQLTHSLAIHNYTLILSSILCISGFSFR